MVGATRRMSSISTRARREAPPQSARGEADRLQRAGAIADESARLGDAFEEEAAKPTPRSICMHPGPHALEVERPVQKLVAVPTKAAVELLVEVITDGLDEV